MKISLSNSNSNGATLGIDIGGTNIRSVVIHDGIFGEVKKIKTPNSYDDLLNAISEIIKESVGSHKQARVGIGLPGRTDPEKPIWVPTLPFLNQSNLVADLKMRADIRVTLINDAQAALVGEANYGAAKGCRNAILVTLGTGIGGGVLIDGKIYVGHHGTAGSFGWLMAPVRLHPNPEHGPWERWSSGRTFSIIARGLEVSVEEILSDKSGPNSVLRDALVDFSTRIGKGLGSLASVFDPQIILVSGGLVDSWSLLKTGVVEGFAQTASPSVRDTQVKVAALGSESGAIGAACTARDYFSEVST